MVSTSLRFTSAWHAKRECGRFRRYMQTYFQGQRWISETEPELGLGLVVEVTPRTVQVLYHAANETRQYAVGNAPLKRVRFAAGDRVASNKGDKQTGETITEEEDSGVDS